MKERAVIAAVITTAGLAVTSGVAHAPAPTICPLTSLTYLATRRRLLLRGFGAVFSDVDLANTTFIQYFGVNKS
jgi:hypothetical protein